jgi:SAM-dependent methyltransferase
LSDKRVLDFGCGAGIDGVTYAERGASVTFVDIVQDNVDLVKRVCDFKGIEADYLYLERLKDINRLGEYDVILAMGSLHHAPYDFVKREVGLLLPHLISGGRWLQLAYPKERWIRDGSPPFSKWGEMTDGADTPWAEWYDVEKVLSLFDVDVRVIMTRKFNNNRFAWFDFEIL